MADVDIAAAYERVQADRSFRFIFYLEDGVTEEALHRFEVTTFTFPDDDTFDIHRIYGDDNSPMPGPCPETRDGYKWIGLGASRLLYNTDTKNLYPGSESNTYHTAPGHLWLRKTQPLTPPAAEENQPAGSALGIPTVSGCTILTEAFQYTRTDNYVHKAELVQAWSPFTGGILQPVDCVLLTERVEQGQDTDDYFLESWAIYDHPVYGQIAIESYGSRHPPGGPTTFLWHERLTAVSSLLPPPVPLEPPRCTFPSVAVDEIIVRIRRLFLEEGGPDFVDNVGDFPWEILDAYDQGCQRQLERVIDNAEKTGQLRRHDSDYLLHFLVHRSIPIQIGTQDYPRPTGMMKALAMIVNGREATFKATGFDQLMQRAPSRFGPAPGQSFWTFIPNQDGGAAVRLYVAGAPAVAGGGGTDGSVPNEAGQGFLDFYRQCYLLAYQSPASMCADTPEPYNRGPVKWAVAQLLRKTGHGATQKAERLEGAAVQDFDAIISPPPPKQANA